MANKDLLGVILGVLIPPIEVFRMKNMGQEFLICLLLWLFTLVGGIWYTFYLKGVEIVADILCLIIPPLGVFVGNKMKCKNEVWICLLLCCLVAIIPSVPALKEFVYATPALWLPAVIYAYYVV